ncbi:MAG TPA: 4-(cytidine 5'-diphospho)-2-C-methyl-D-erythritol kinase [Chthoniobacteraceae bacterium]|jgi:4-diphosphocytidyl-2-C-methyl-D-erythritol kinase
MMELLAPAKINLSLRVKAKREDGFHEIETLMCPISVFDRLEIETLEEEGLQLTCDDPTIPTGEENLVVRAARLFCGEVGLQPNLRITLSKGIPHGAGLGGGSSDAATMLLGLNHLFQTDLPRATLATMAAELGSDVPFFIYQSAAVCRGRGEFVEPAPFRATLPLLLIKPPFGVPTPWAYRRWKDSVEVPGVSYAPQEFPWGTLVNDLERPVFEKYLFLPLLKKWLADQPEVAGALMSGSGSTMLAVLTDADSAETLGVRLAEQFGSDLWCRLCQTIANPE